MPDRSYYADTLFDARAAVVETGERMMVRLLAFILNAHRRLILSKGISTDEEPDFVACRLFR